jgi:hypothetical protein
MDGAKGSLAYLEDWANSGDQVALGVPIIPKSDGKAVGSLADGAAGDYDQYFIQLATTLVQEGLGNAYLRLGWEFDNRTSTYAWETGNDTQQENDFAEYFQDIVTTMRGVSGADFQYVWDPDGFAFLTQQDYPVVDPVYNGYYDLQAAWPGATYVNYIGLNLYDLAPSSGYTPTETWDDYIELQLTAAEEFASQNGGVPLAFPEWGVERREMKLYGMGDDPLYINNMYCFMINPSNNVAWESYFNISGADQDSEITGGSFPKSLAAFQSDFGYGADCSG